MVLICFGFQQIFNMQKALEDYGPYAAQQAFISELC